MAARMNGVMQAQKTGKMQQRTVLEAYSKAAPAPGRPHTLHKSGFAFSPTLSRTGLAGWLDQRTWAT